MITVVIPAYKKTDLLVKNLRKNLPFLRGYKIIVVNDYPGTSIKKDLENFPIKLLENKKNLGFGGAVNKGVKAAKTKYVMLLNTDVALNDNSFIKALPYFRKNHKLFAVSFAQEEQDMSIVGKNIIYWRNGFFRHQKARDLLLGKNAWAEGGASIIDREKFLNLAGFDMLYSPFYWEDIDLSYRAWRSGLEIFFVSQIKVRHYHESTIGSFFSKKTINTIAYRNQLIFIWKNITDKKLLFSHFILFIPNLILFLLKGDLNFFKGLFQALAKLPEILAKRKMNKQYAISDSEILESFS